MTQDQGEVRKSLMETNFYIEVVNMPYNGIVDVTKVTNVGDDGVSESFDEPLNKEEVLAIGGLFIV